MQNRSVSNVLTRLVLVGGALFFPMACYGGEADVVAATAIKTGDKTYRFDVTVAHEDTGWDHYANVWQVIGPDGAILGERVLAHPHVTEQPFTRSLSGVTIPEDITSITLRAGDLVHEFGGKELYLELPKQPGQSVTVAE
jgi:methionine-rich copper-binding protein CopC